GGSGAPPPRSAPTAATPASSTTVAPRVRPKARSPMPIVTAASHAAKRIPGPVTDATAMPAPKAIAGGASGVRWRLTRRSSPAGRLDFRRRVAVDVLGPRRGLRRRVRGEWRLSWRSATPRAARLDLWAGPRGSRPIAGLRSGAGRSRRRRPVELLDLLDEVRVGAAPVADGEAEARGNEQKQQHEELAARVQGHEPTIPLRRPRD